MNKPIKLLLVLLFTAPLMFGAGTALAKQAQAPTKESRNTPTSAKINRHQLDELLTKPNELLIIDLRRPDEVSSIGGFPVYLSIQANELEKKLDFIPKDRVIVTVSNHAGRSGKAADLLASKGYKVAGYVGAQYYEEEGGKLTKIVPPPKSKPTLGLKN